MKEYPVSPYVRIWIGDKVINPGSFFRVYTLNQRGAPNIIRFRGLDGSTATYNPKLTIVQIEHQPNLYNRGVNTTDSLYHTNGRERWHEINPDRGIQRLDRVYIEVYATPPRQAASDQS